MVKDITMQQKEGTKPRMMAKTILDNIKLDEVWGNEISLRI